MVTILVAAAKSLHEKESKGKTKGKDDKVHIVFSRGPIDSDGETRHTYLLEDAVNREEPIEVYLKLSKIAKNISNDLILFDNQTSVSVFGNVDLRSNLRTARPCNNQCISTSDIPISSSQTDDYHGSLEYMHVLELRTTYYRSLNFKSTAPTVMTKRETFLL